MLTTTINDGDDRCVSQDRQAETRTVRQRVGEKTKLTDSVVRLVRLCNRRSPGGGRRERLGF